MKSKQLILVSLILAVTLPVIGLVVNALNNDRDSQDTEAPIMVDGLKRTYLMHTPPDRDQSKPLPLVINNTADPLMSWQGGEMTVTKMKDIKLTHCKLASDIRIYIWFDARKKNKS